jgi:predicted PurR-regulated permease PerM
VIFALVWLGLLVVVLFLVRDVIGAFVLGGLIAFVIEPIVDRLSRMGVPRALGIAGTLIGLLLLLAGLLTLVVPLFTEEIPTLQAEAPAVAAAAQAKLSRLQGSPLNILGYRVNLSTMTEALNRNAGGFLVGQFGTALSIGLAALGTVAQVGLMLLIAFLASLDAPRLGRFMRGLAPTAYRDDVELVLRDVQRMLHLYVRGQLVVAGMLGVFSGLAVWLIGLKYTALVPYLGPFLGAVPAVVVALAIGWKQAIAVAIAYLVISNVVLNAVYPRVIGGALRLPALVVIVAFIAGFSLAGVLGMFVAVPVAATCRIVYDHLRPRLYGEAMPRPPDPRTGSP